MHRAVFLASLPASLLLAGSIAPAASQRAPVTFAETVAPLLFSHCVQCHHPNGPAPFSLASYEEARQRARRIADVTAKRLMPPWKSAPGYGDFVGHDHLSTEQIEILEQWAADGAPLGSPDAVPMPRWNEGWQLGTPDLVLPLPEPYTLRADGPEVFRVFVIPVPLTSLRWVRGLEFRPGIHHVVHHARIRIDPTPASRELDERDPAPGYEGLILRSAAYPDGHFLGWTPGQVGPMLPPGLAWRLTPGASFVVELHLVPSGRVETIAPSIGLYFTDDAPTRTPAILRLGRQTLDIPAGEREYLARDSFVLPVDVELQSVQPHAHHRARQVVAEAALPDGSKKPLIFIKDWDVRWQHLYRYVEPVVLPKGTTLTVRFTFDNSADNPHNPWRPPRRVLWGEESTSEMDELWIQMLPRDPRDLQRLYDAIGPKMAEEDVRGLELRLQSDPANTHLHDEAAEALLFLGRPKEAAEHFAATAAAQPDSATAHYNVATALARAGDLPKAAHHFRRALAIRPDYPQAHNNLGAVLMREGFVLEALAQYEGAIEDDPEYADAHYNAGSILRSLGRLDEAAARFRKAVALRPDWPRALASLALLLASAPRAELRDPVEAVRHAERASQLSGKQDPALLDILAVAYASAGNFVQAIAASEAALDLTSDPALARDLRERQQLFRQHRAYIAPRE